MTPLKTLLTQYPSKLSFARAYGIHPYQLNRWLDNDAHVNELGEVYIRTKGKLVKPEAV